MARRRTCLGSLALVAALAGPAGAAGQDVEEVGGSLLSAGIGTTVGLVGGAYANVAIVVLKARVGHYQHSFKEAFGWESTPILIGGGVGFAIGFWDEDRLWPWIGAGTAGLLTGAGVGYMVGSLVWGDEASRWADAAIGAAIGMSAASLGAVFLLGGDDDDPSSVAAAGSAPALSLPLIRVRF